MLCLCMVLNEILGHESLLTPAIIYPRFATDLSNTMNQHGLGD
jgi:hypothetical protein